MELTISFFTGVLLGTAGIGLVGALKQHRRKRAMAMSPSQPDNPVPSYRNTAASMEQFAQVYDLELNIQENGDSYFVQVKNAETKQGHWDPFLRGQGGAGHTREEALAMLARDISNRLLVINAISSERRSIKVPDLTRPGNPHDPTGRTSAA